MNHDGNLITEQARIAQELNNYFLWLYISLMRMLLHRLPKLFLPLKSIIYALLLLFV